MVMFTTIQSRQNILYSRLLSKHERIRIYIDHNFAYCSVWVWNLVSDINGEAQTEGVWEQRAEDTIWTEESWSDGRWKNCLEGAS
jgi:hypothetical protein